MTAEHRSGSPPTLHAASATAAALRTIEEARRRLDDARTSGELAERIEEIRARLRTSLETVEASAKDGMASLGRLEAGGERSARDEIAEAERKIRENPLGAVVVAAGLGLLVGLVLRRR